MSTTHISLDGASDALRTTVAGLVTQIGTEVKSRGFRVANELRTASNHVLAGQRHGRRYKIPGTYREKREVVGTYTDKKGRTRNRTRGTGEYEYHKYKKGVYYTASAPGEPPAVRTGMFRMSWKQRAYAEELGGGECNVHGCIENDQKAGSHLLGEMLERGTKRMAPRPYKQRVVDRAMPKVLKIYNEPYIKG